jgi:hypothetical protein
MRDPMVATGRLGDTRGMVRLPLVEMQVRVCQNRAVDGRVGHDRVPGRWPLCDPLAGPGGVWRWPVEADPTLPRLAQVLAGCHGFLIDDDCGRAVGVVEDVVREPGSANPTRLLVVQGWGRRRITVPVDDVVRVKPEARRLVTRCAAGHRPQRVEPTRTWWGRLVDLSRSVRSLLARTVAADPSGHEAGDPAGRQGSMRPRRMA